MSALKFAAALGGSAAWTPADLAVAPYLWLDASNSGSISHTANAVDTWSDISGNGRNFTGSGATRPTTNTVTQNGLNVIDFAADYLNNATAGGFNVLHNGTLYSIHVVVQFGVVANPNAAYGLFGTNATSSANIGASMWFDDRAGVPRNNNGVHTVTNAGQVVNNVAGDNFFPVNSFFLYRLTADPSNATAASRSTHKYGGTTASNNSATGSVSASNHTYQMQIGATGNNTLPLTGRIAEIVILGYAGTTDELNNIDTYLANKWAV